MTVRSFAKIGLAAESFPDRVYRDGKFQRAVSVERGPVLTNAPSVTEAKAAFAEAVGSFLDLWETPRVYCFRGNTFVLSVTPGGLNSTEPGFSYTIISDGVNRSSCNFGAASWAEAERDTKRHLAQYSVKDYNSVVQVQAAFDYLGDDPDGQYEHLRYSAWQRAAQWALKVGAADVHAWACDHENHFLADLLPLIDGAKDNRIIRSIAGIARIDA